MAQRTRAAGKACRVKAGLVGGAHGFGRSVNSKAAAGLVQFLNSGERRKAQAGRLPQ